MFPTIYELQTSFGPVGFNTYGLMLVMAFSAAFVLVHVRAARVGLDPDKMIPTYVGAAVGGILGGRLLYAFAVDWERTLSDPLSLFSSGGFAVYGGVFGGTVGVAIVAALIGLRPWKVADLAGPSVLIGMGVGRIGCFFSGCCHGVQAPIGDAPIGLLGGYSGGQIWLSGVAPFVTNELHGGVGRLHDVPIYPTQMWAVLALCGLSAALFWYWPRRRFDGEVAALAMILEPPTRIFIESFRADERGYAFTFPVSDSVAQLLPGLTQAGESLDGAVMGITTSQAIGLGIIACGLLTYALRFRSGVAEEVETQADDDLLDELLT